MHRRRCLHCEGEELSEEFKEKAKTIFEAAINSKVAEIKEALEAQYEENLKKKLKKQKSHSLSVLILILSMLLTSGLKRTQLAVEAGLKTEMTESFLDWNEESF